MRDVLASGAAQAGHALIKREADEESNCENGHERSFLSNYPNRRGFSIDSILGNRHRHTLADLHKCCNSDRSRVLRAERTFYDENRNFSDDQKSFPTARLARPLEAISGAHTLAIEPFPMVRSADSNVTKERNKKVTDETTNAGRLPNISRFFEPLDSAMRFTDTPIGDATTGVASNNPIRPFHVSLLKDIPVLRNFGRIEMNNRMPSGAEPQNSTNITTSVRPIAAIVTPIQDMRQSSPRMLPVKVPPPDTESAPLEWSATPNASESCAEIPSIRNNEHETLQVKEETGNATIPVFTAGDPAEKENDQRLHSIHRVPCGVSNQRKVHSSECDISERVDGVIKPCEHHKNERYVLDNGRDPAGTQQKFEREATNCGRVDSAYLISNGFPARSSVSSQVRRCRRSKHAKSKKPHLELKEIRVEHDQSQFCLPQQAFLQNHLYEAQQQRFFQQQERLIQLEHSVLKFSPDIPPLPVQISHQDRAVDPLHVKFRRADRHPKLDEGTSTMKKVKPGYMCDKCGKSYCRKYVLKIHQRVHSGEKPLVCQICGKSFSDPSNMKKHVKLHETDHVTYPCKFCGRNFVRRRGLLNHLHSMHSRTPSSLDDKGKPDVGIQGQE